MTADKNSHVCATIKALRDADRALCLQTDLDAAEEHLLAAWQSLQAAAKIEAREKLNVK